MPSVIRVIRWYERPPGESFVGEAVLEVSLRQLQAVFGVASDDPMYDCYRVEERHLSGILSFVSIRIELSEFQYFVESYSD